MNHAKTVRGMLKKTEEDFKEKTLKIKAIRESIKAKIEKEGLNADNEKRLILLGEMITKAKQKEDKTRVIELKRAFNDLIELRKSQEKNQKLKLKKPIEIIGETINEMKKLERDFKLKLLTKKNKPLKKSEKLTLCLVNEKGALTKEEKEKWHKEAMKEFKRLMNSKP